MPAAASRDFSVLAGFDRNGHRRPLALQGGRWVLCALAALLASCAPIPRQVYVPHAEGGVTQFSTCAFNTHVPVGVALRVPGLGVQAQVHMGLHEGRNYVELRLQVPKGEVVVMQAATVELVSRNPARRWTAEFPAASLVDNPIVNATSAIPALRKQQLPATAALEGADVTAGSATFARNFWFAADIGPVSAEEVTVSFPPFLVNDVRGALPSVTFKREAVVSVALINC